MPKTSSIKINCHQIGIGFDSHAFSDSGTLVLGGVRFSGVNALKGHSDGDALLHAVIDSLLGGTSSGDIGELFPDTSSKFRGISSVTLLSQVAAKIAKKGFRVHHLDVIVVADRPKLGPAKKKIKNLLSKVLKVSPSSINIKAKTQEGLQWFNAPGGVAVWAASTLSKN